VRFRLESAQDAYNSVAIAKLLTNNMTQMIAGIVIIHGFLCGPGRHALCSDLM